MLLNCSKSMTLPPEVWWGFLELPLATTLTDTQIVVTVEILTKFFWDLRAPKQVRSIPFSLGAFPIYLFIYLHS